MEIKMNKSSTIMLSAGSVILLTLIYVYWKTYHKENIIDYPCPLADTVDLTGYEKLPNQSYLYQDLLIPPTLWGIYEYTTDEFSLRIPAKPHVRGCICKLRPCVKFCCPLTQRRSRQGHCRDFNKKNHTTEMEITLSNGELSVVNVTKKFSIQYSRTCEQMFYLRPDRYPEEDPFILFENSTLVVNKEYSFSKEQFCLGFLLNDTKVYNPAPMRCNQSNSENDLRVKTSAYTMLTSVPFFILTIIIYLVLPELNTIHGKSLCCYLLGLSFAYAILSVIILSPANYFSELKCKIIGFSGYFFLISAYCWLSVMSFDLYYNFCVARARLSEKKRFILYSIYAWGLAFIVVCLTFAADNLQFVPEEWKPSINNAQYCWFNGIDGWTAMIYVYIPNVVFIGFCIVMFSLTVRKIYSVQKMVTKVMTREDSRKHLRADRERLGVYLRLLIVMGVTWCVDIIPYLIGSHTSTTLAILNYFIDFVNGILGPIIFVLFGCKENVRRLIKKRIPFSYFSEAQNVDSNKTTTISSSTVPTSMIQMQTIGPFKPMMKKEEQIQHQ